jgi:hypothetical protein
MTHSLIQPPSSNLELFPALMALPTPLARRDRLIRKRRLGLARATAHMVANEN